MHKATIYICGILTGAVIIAAITAIFMVIARPRYNIGAEVRQITRLDELALLIFNHEVKISNGIETLAMLESNKNLGDSFTVIDGVKITGNDIIDTLKWSKLVQGGEGTRRVKLICSFHYEDEIFRYSINESP